MTNGGDLMLYRIAAATRFRSPCRQDRSPCSSVRKAIELFCAVGLASAGMLGTAARAADAAPVADVLSEGATPEATSPPRSDARFKALFLMWRAQDGPRSNMFGIPSGEPTPVFSITSGFGVRSDPFQGRAALHPGIDLAGPVGSPIYATADGIVSRSEWNSGGYGNLVEINHGGGLQTRYGHLSKRIAQPGQRIRRGDLIGLMGSTGRSTGSHLHYEVRIDGRAVNPVAFMPIPESQFAARYAQSAKIAEGGPRRGTR